MVEFTQLAMGPACGMILADLGAEVIKVEPPGGDNTRNLPGLGIGFFRCFNRNKKSMVLDIHSPVGMATALELIGGCDVCAGELPAGNDERPKTRGVPRRMWAWAMPRAVRAIAVPACWTPVGAFRQREGASADARATGRC